MIGNIPHPVLILIIGALLLPFVRGPIRKIYLMIVPLLTFASVLSLNTMSGEFGLYQFMDWQLVFARVDKLSAIFGFIMALMCVIGTLYGNHVDRAGEHMAAWIYVAGSLGTIYCGDYLSLFLFWEMMAFASTFLIWFRRGKRSTAVGYRYLLIHTLGGVILLAGIMLRYQATQDISFVALDVDHPQLYTYLIMIGFALNAAVVPLHSWLPDAYGEASFNGAVFMCAFTTKTAVYTLARSCSGFDILIILGVIMAVYGVIYAIMENDIRKLLAWSIISQVGYMVAGVGIGTDMAINGACAHAVAHILYKGLLFMGTGAILYQTGKTKFTQLGGLYAKMPATMIFTVVGCLSISAAPFFSGFVTKSMIISAAGEEHLYWVVFTLMFAATGTFIYNGLKLPYFIWFGKNNCSEETLAKAKDPNWNMQLAMALAALGCILIGSFPQALYNMLPYSVAYHPYGGYHVAETLQVIGFAALAFFMFKKYLVPKDTLSLDMDWLYRRGAAVFMWVAKNPIQGADTAWSKAYRAVGLLSLMTLSRFWSWFDWNIIDTVVDGIARSVRAMGGRIRCLQSGQIQYTIYYAATFIALIVTAFAFYQLS